MNLCINDLVLPSFDKSHIYLVIGLCDLNICYPCDVCIRRIDKKNIFENNIYTCSSCLKKYDHKEKLGINIQLTLF